MEPGAGHRVCILAVGLEHMGEATSSLIPDDQHCIGHCQEYLLSESIEHYMISIGEIS